MVGQRKLDGGAQEDRNECH
jgi:hypothetical protein